ncbi:MAG: dockerin type I repeat-containing protein [Oscillospiraceae bacterium]|nr:dockerin type I repeat-containing protein [Oscillospiraceae bacterium]
MKQKRLPAVLSAVLVSLAAIPCEPVFSLQERDTPADIDKAAYDYLIKWDLAYADKNKDGVISDKELSEAGHITLDLTDVKDISWMSRLKDCWLLELKNGSLTDFSVLGGLTNLSNLEMRAVPAEDISFLEKLDLEECELINMPQITDAMRMKQMRFKDLSIIEGCCEKLSYSPHRLANVTMTISDPDTARFLGANTESDLPDPRVYAVKEGETTYTVSLNGKEYYTGKITVHNEDVSSDPALGSETVTGCEVFRSTYYCPAYDHTPEETHFFHTAVLIGNTLYAIRGNKTVSVMTDVADFETLTLYSDTKTVRNDVECDAVRLKDGTVLVNGRKIIDEPCTALRGAAALGESGTLYEICALTDLSITAKPIASDIECMAEGCPELYLKKDGCLCCIHIIGYGADPVIKETEIAGLPVSALSLSLTSYFVDGTGTQYSISFSENVPLVNVFTVSKQNTDAERVEYVYDENGRRYVACRLKDGTFKLLFDMFDNWNYDFIEEEMHWGALDLDAGTCFQYLPLDEAHPEDRVFITYYLDGNHDLNFRWKAKNVHMSHVLRVLPNTCSSDDANKLWVLREDGSFWYYDLNTAEWIKSETVEQTASGDLYSDGECTLTDAVYLREFLNGSMPLSGNWSAADMNKDGTIDGLDLTLLLRKIHETKSERMN